MCADASGHTRKISIDFTEAGYCVASRPVAAANTMVLVVSLGKSQT